ncbi:MAG: flagellar basal body P-ring formation chaperone FlgA [Comamonas sp.]
MKRDPRGFWRRTAPVWLGLTLACGWALAVAGGAAQAAGAGAGADPRIPALVEALLRQEAASLPGTLSLAIAPVALGNRAACSELSLDKPDRFRLRPDMTLGVRCVAPQRWSIYVRVRASVAGRYPVAAQTLGVGELITPQAYVWREGDLLALPGDAVLDEKQLEGRSARQRIAAGQPLRAGALRSAQTVARGALVKLTVQGEGFTVSREGATALEEGAPGSTISVRTPSGQIVSGIVRGAGVVEVGL